MLEETPELSDWFTVFGNMSEYGLRRVINRPVYSKLLSALYCVCCSEDSHAQVKVMNARWHIKTPCT